MPILQQLLVDKLRNLKSVDLSLHPRFNLFYGDNGCGKTSLLESLYLLATGKSFRANIKSHLINYDSESFSLYCIIEDNDQQNKIGLEKSRNKPTRLKINGEFTRKLSSASKLLPIILIDPNSYGLLEQGPSRRREFLDWGLFHVKQAYPRIWSEFTHCLKQRNAALKAGLQNDQCIAWDEILISKGEEITRLRKSYFKDIVPYFEDVLKDLGSDLNVDISYYCGWDSTVLFSDALNQVYSKDRLLGYTTVGPQKANIKFEINKLPAADVLSRGQTKLLVIALQLAQGLHYAACFNKQPIYLFDDIASELDKANKEQLDLFILSIQGQVFITSPDINTLADSLKENGQMFHVKQGDICQSEIKMPLKSIG
jgi:DNA replication and repair protein RecF